MDSITEIFYYFNTCCMRSNTSQTTIPSFTIVHWHIVQAIQSICCSAKLSTVLR